jgi:hypothetical protein
MSERVEARSGVSIVARTVHAFAYDTIGIVEGSRPAMTDHATDDMAFSTLIKQILKDLVHCLSEVSKAIIQFFAHFLVEPKTEWDFKTKHDFYTHMESQDLRTLQGEKVKSYEDLQIANWLYENGVNYEYEPRYEHKVSEIGRRDYQPDFRLTESGNYIQHFGVRGRGALVTNLSRSGSFHSCERITPPNRGIKHLGPSPPSKPRQSLQLRQHFRPGVCGSCAACGARLPDTLPQRHLLNPEELSRSKGCVLRPTRAADLVAVVGLLAAQGRAGEAVGAAQASGKGGHHDVAGDRSDDEGGRDDEALRHQHHHEEGQEGPDVGCPFRVAQFGDER